LIFYLLRRWYILYKNTWIECEHFTQTILTWIHLIETVYNNSFETGKLIGRFLTSLFPPIDHDLEKLNKIKYTTDDANRRTNR
jgi:hypothetical protein